MAINLHGNENIDIQELLRWDECEFLDFKSQFPTTNSDLIHDILCLSNSVISSDRFLVFGINDDKSISGIENDTRRKTLADIITTLRSARLNKIPKTSMQTLSHEGHEIDVLIIKNVAEKPYFLNEDYTQGRPLRAGVIYSRISDTNVPSNGTSSDHLIESMFHERMGLNLTPAERVDLYLKDIINWKMEYNEKNELFFYYSKFPEFTFVKDSDSSDPFEVEEWVQVFPDKKATSVNCYLRYHSTILEKFVLVWCDGARYLTVLPRTKVLWKGEDYYRIVYFIKDSREFLLNKMIQSIYAIQSEHYINGSILEFENEKQKNDYIAPEENFTRGPSFFCSSKDKKRYKIFNSEKILLTY